MKEIWREIRGFGDQYEISNRGNVRNARTGAVLRQRSMNNGMAFVVTLKKADGKRAPFTVSRLLYETFFGEIPGDMCVVHKNGIHSDIFLENLEIVSRSDCSRIGISNKERKTVFKVDRDGNVLDVYRNCVEAAKMNYMSAANIRMHLRRKTKNPFKYQDYTFVFEGGA